MKDIKMMKNSKNMKTAKCNLFIFLLCWSVYGYCAEPASEPPLIEDIQTLKKEVLQLNRDLFILEEDLLFPSSTQLNIYVSLDRSNYFIPDAVELKVNNKSVQSHLYTAHEVSALARGGMQKLYQGNVKQGEHSIVAIFTGQGPENRPYRRAVEYQFKHTGDPVHIELSIEDAHAAQQPEFKVKQWQP